MDPIAVPGLVLGLALLAGIAVAVRRRTAASRPEPPRQATPEPGAAPAGELECPVCAHTFTPPSLMVITKAERRRYGRDPVQCPECHHIWNAGRKIKTIRS